MSVGCWVSGVGCLEAIYYHPEQRHRMKLYATSSYYHSSS